jgi:hypothetical protein
MTRQVYRRALVTPVAMGAQLRRRRTPPLSTPADDLVDETPRQRLLRGHVVVTLDVVRDLVQGAAAVPGVDPDDQVALAQDLACVDLEVAGLALQPGHPWLVDQDQRVGQRRARATGACGEEE